MALRYPLKLSFDEDYELRLKWKTKTGNGPPVDVDITPYTFSLVVLNTVGATVATFNCSKEDGYVVLDLTAADVNSLPLGIRCYRLKAVGPSNRVLLSGSIAIVN